MIKGCANPSCSNNTTGSEYCGQCSAAIQDLSRMFDPALESIDSAPRTATAVMIDLRAKEAALRAKSNVDANNPNAITACSPRGSALKALDDEFYPPEMQVGKGPRFYTPPAGWGIQLRPEEVRTHSLDAKFAHAMYPQIRKDSSMPPTAIRIEGGGYTGWVYNLEPAPALANMEFVE